MVAPGVYHSNACIISRKGCLPHRPSTLAPPLRTLAPRPSHTEFSRPRCPHFMPSIPHPSHTCPPNARVSSTDAFACAFQPVRPCAGALCPPVIPMHHIFSDPRGGPLVGQSARLSHFCDTLCLVNSEGWALYEGGGLPLLLPWLGAAKDPADRTSCVRPLNPWVPLVPPPRWPGRCARGC